MRIAGAIEQVDGSMCDTMVAMRPATAAGNVLFAKNSDRDFTESQHLEWVSAACHEAGARLWLTHVPIDQVRQTHAVLLSKPYWIWGAEIGTNEHGLVIGNEAVFCKIPPSQQPGIIGMDFVRLALERAGGVDEAIQVITTLLRKHGQSGNCSARRELYYHNSFLIADPQGAKVLETVDREWVAAPVANFYAISNILTVEEGFESASPSLRSRAVEAGIYKEGAPFSFKSVYQDEAKMVSGTHRRQRAGALFEEQYGGIQPADLMRILRDHVAGASIAGRPGAKICAHSSNSLIGHTTASWIADLAQGKHVHWVTATASACTGVFKPVMVETGIPSHGPKPGAAPENESLWWRHEKLRSYLAGCSEEIVRSFNEEREALEARFQEQVANCPAITDVGRRDEAQRIIEACWRDALAFEAKWYERS